MSMLVTITINDRPISFAPKQVNELPPKHRIVRTDLLTYILIHNGGYEFILKSIVQMP